MANVRVGFIGCGGIANGKHFPGMAQQEGVDMCAFCDLILERAEKAAKEYGTPDAKVYTDYHELEHAKRATEVSENLKQAK